MTRKLLPLLVVLAALGALPAAAGASPSWLAPTTVASLGASGSTGYSKVAMDPNGDAIVVWLEMDDRGTPAPGDDIPVVKAAYRPAGGTFGDPTTISDNTTTYAYVPQVGMDDAGNALIVWAEDAVGATIPRYRSRSADGTLGPIKNLALAAGGEFVQTFETTSYSTSPRLAINKDGKAVVVWGTSNSVVRAAKGTIAGGFDAATPLNNAADGTLYSLSTAIDDAGDALFAFEQDSGIRWRIYSRAWPAGSTSPIGPGPELRSVDADNNRSANPVVAMTPDGRATMVWSHSIKDPDPATSYQVRVVYQNRTAPADWGTGVWSVQDDVYAPESSGGTGYRFPDLVVTPSNMAVVIWTSVVAPNRVRTAVRSSGGGFGSEQTLSGPGVSTVAPHLATNARGDVLAVFPSTVGGNPVIQSALIPAGQNQFGATKEDLDTAAPAPSSFPPPYGQVALDDEGNGIGVWTRQQGPVSQFDLRVAGFDQGAPRLNGISVPDTGVAGKPIAMSISPLDVWSTPTTTWEFGDGTTATGASVSHVYANPGNVTVRVTAADPFGNASTTTRIINVTASIVDADGDGSPSNVDCNDNNPAIRPNATDTPGNGVDEDCSGADTVLKLGSSVRTFWRAFKTYTTISTLALRNVPAGAVVYIKCKGKGCPFKKTKKLTFKKAKGVSSIKSLFNYTKGKGKKKRKHVSKLKVGTTIEVQFTLKNAVGRWYSYKMRARKLPKQSDGCLAVNTVTKTKC